MAISDHDNELDLNPPNTISIPDALPQIDPTQQDDQLEPASSTSPIDISSANTEVLYSSTISQSQEQTRAKIALTFTYAFLFLVSFSVLFPFALHMTRSDIFPQPLVAIKELITTIASILAGPFGFIVGFYFKKDSD